MRLAPLPLSIYLPSIPLHCSEAPFPFLPLKLSLGLAISLSAGPSYALYARLPFIASALRLPPWIRAKCIASLQSCSIPSCSICRKM
jgi:hypothetical protein